MELRQGTQDWYKMVTHLVQTFAFVDDQPTIDTVLQMIKEKIFDEIPIVVESSNYFSTTNQQWMACYNLAGEPDDDPTNINIPKSEGMCEVKGTSISRDQFLK